MKTLTKLLAPVALSIGLLTSCDSGHIHTMYEGETTYGQTTMARVDDFGFSDDLVISINNAKIPGVDLPDSTNVEVRVRDYWDSGEKEISYVSIFNKSKKILQYNKFGDGHYLDSITEDGARFELENSGKTDSYQVFFDVVRDIVWQAHNAKLGSVGLNCYENN